MRILIAVLFVFVAGCHHGPSPPDPWAHIEVYFSTPTKAYEVVGPVYAYAGNEPEAINWLRRGTFQKFNGQATAVIVKTMGNRITGGMVQMGRVGIDSQIFITGDAIRFQ